MKGFFLTLFIGIALNHAGYAQFGIGHRQMGWQDPARANRDVQTEIYYPAATGGENVSCANGQFPVIVFGHGYLMGYDAYGFWKDNLVPRGYILVFPTTEGGLSPDHAAFGADLSFVLNSVKAENGNNSSPFYQRIGLTSAIAGHSMGGGSSFLACAGNAVPTCLFTFAAAETDPSAIAAATNITIPALVVAGADDCVAEPATNQQPMYNALASTCKAWVSINNGAHCYFGDYNFTCTFGESTCNPVPSITREEQLDAALDITVLFIDHFLKNQANAWNIFSDTITYSTRLTGSINCPSSNAYNSENEKPVIYPNPASDMISISYNKQETDNIYITNVLGVRVPLYAPLRDAGDRQFTIDCSEWPRGIYFLNTEIKGNPYVQKIIVR